MGEKKTVRVKVFRFDPAADREPHYDTFELEAQKGFSIYNALEYIVDRKKDMVIAGGYNIYPRDIEEVLFTHPKILEAAVAGIKDPYRGETLKAYVVVKEGEKLTEEEVIEFCKANLAAYKVPKLVEFRDELPKTMVGKILRRVLREEEEKKAAQQAGQQ